MPVVATRAERDEIPQIVSGATLGYGGDVVNLEPDAKTARAAPGTGVPVAGERGKPNPLPFCGAPNQVARFAGCAAGT